MTDRYLHMPCRRRTDSTRCHKVPARLRRAAISLVAFVSVSVATTMPPTARALDNTPWTTPTVPAKCTTAQANSGFVAGCVVMGGTGTPESVGWPAPPFPTTVSGQPFPPAGWTWNGYTYNGSPALSGWEPQMVANATAIGSLAANRLVGLPEPMALFEGFLREVNAAGYAVRDGYAYSFRCTSSSTRNCYGLTRSKLSNHTWGLAIDINSGANPVRVYYGINGQSACKTPMVTDIPQWVVQTAEKWGLYWGGYGWSAGCSSPAQVKSSASRDPTHFEFRGTPAQARAILLANGAARACVNVVDPAGVQSQRCYLANETPAATTRLVVATGAPAGATAALVNLTTTRTVSRGFVTAEDCGPRPAGPRGWSNTNQTPDRVVAAVAVVPLDASGRFCLYLSSPTHVVVDVQGFFAPAGTLANGTVYRPVAAGRLLNTQVDGYCTPAGSCGAGPVPSGAEVVIDAPTVPSDAAAAVAGLTMFQPSANGFLTAGPCSTLVPGPQPASNLNVRSGWAAANVAVVPVDANGAAARFCTTQSTAAQITADVQGYFSATAAGGLGFSSQTPLRVVDTRECWTPPGGSQRCNVINAAGSIVALTAPAGAQVVLANITITQGTQGGFASVGPCDDMVPGSQPTTTVIYAAASAWSSVAFIPVDAGGEFCVQLSGEAHVVVDVQGTFSPSGPLRYSPVAQTRRLETRANP